jgi:hypothetical protein
VATSFTFRLYPLPLVTTALLLWPAGAGPDVVRAYRDFIDSAPDEVCGGLVYVTGPPEEFVPQHLVGELSVLVLLVYTGGEAEARRALGPMLELGPDGEMMAEMPYAELQCMLDDPPGYRNYWSATYLDALPDEAVYRHCARAADMIVPRHRSRRWRPRVARSPADDPTTPSRGSKRRGSCSRSACGTTRPTTSAPGGGAATSAPTSAHGRATPST